MKNMSGRLMPISRRPGNHRPWGFTLIELMIVVVIMAIISAVIVPMIISSRQKDKLPEAPAVKPGSARPAETAPGPPAVPPETLKAEIKVAVKTQHFLHRLDVFTVFDADFEGEFLFSRPHGDQENVRLFFPFPKGTTKASNVSLKFADEEGQWAEPPNVVYSLFGVRWIGLLAKDRSLKVRVTYSAQGRDKFEYVGPGAGRAGIFKLALTGEGLSPEAVPAEALPPTMIKPGLFVWDYANLITDREVIVELPAALSPIGRTILLAKLAALAVFLFGLGFIYISDLHQPGLLDSFRWGHFLLLAMNYFLFFVIFMVLSLSGRLPALWSIIISAAFSLPLLMLHVSRIIDRNFAVTRMVPLALFTLAMVITGVYGEAAAIYLYVLFLVATVAFLTLTYRTWSEKRKAWIQEKERRLESEKPRLEPVPAPDQPARPGPAPTHEATEGDREAIYCLHCGARRPASKYCPHCGVINPVELSCPRCGQTYRLPIHLISLKPDQTNLFCTSCGQRYSVKEDMGGSVPAASTPSADTPQGGVAGTAA